MLTFLLFLNDIMNVWYNEENATTCPQKYFHNFILL